MSAGARVFVRLYDGATNREGDGELLMLPPPPLTWKGVLSMMIQAVSKDDVEPDDAAIARARLFLLPTDTQGIVAELNARSLRFGVRDNDQFAVCLYGEEYRRPSESAADTTLPVAATDAAATLTTMAALPALNVTTTRLNDSYQSHQQPQDPQNHGPPRGSLFGNSGSAAPPGGSILGSSDASGGGRKTSKRYRSISGKMAAIKSLGDKGIISAEDRGHLKDLLLNNDSPALQEALDNYQNTGDFQAVKELLMKELRTPSTKRATSDWLPEGLINEISENFQTHDNDDQSSAYSRYQNHTPTNPFMYGSSAASTTTGHASPSQASDYTTTTDHHDQAVHPLTNASGYEEQQQESWSSESTGGGIYAQQQATTYGTTSTPQINLPLRNRNSVNLMLKHRGVDGSSPVAQQLPSQSMLHGNPVEIGYAQQHPGAMPGYAMAPPAGYPAMGYATPATGDYSQMGMTAAYGVPMHASPVHAQMGYSPYYRQQQPMMYGVSPYGQQYAMSGYDYYAQQGYGYMRAGQLGGRMGMGGKWTTAPPMPAYPPPCSKEEKKEKIAKWLKKRENRNWSNKPSYPVRHNIAKNRKRGEDGRFITKKRLAEMEKEEAARIAAGLPPTIRDDDNELDNDQYQDDEDGSGSDQDGSTMPLGMLDGNEFTGLPTPVHT